MRKLWKRFGGEPFLINPHLFVLNRKRKKVMAKRKRRTPPRNSKGRFVKAGSARKRTHRAAAPHRRRRVTRIRSRAKRIMVVRNPRRRRYSARRVHRIRRYRRNPSITSMIGLNAPTLKTVGFTVGGMVGTPFVEGFVTGMVPASLQGNKVASYAIKIASAVAVGFGVGKIFGKEAGKAAYIGGAAYIAVQAIREFLPAVSTPTVTTGTGRYLGEGPLLGMYPGMGGSAMTSSIPDRLQPGSRF